MPANLIQFGQQTDARQPHVLNGGVGDNFRGKEQSAQRGQNQTATFTLLNQQIEWRRMSNPASRETSKTPPLPQHFAINGFAFAGFVQ